MSLLNSAFYLLLSLAALSQFVNADLIADVCSKPGFGDTFSCEKALRADPRALKAADLKELGKISIDISRNSAKSGLALVKSLLTHAKEKTEIAIYESCVATYRGAVETCDNCDAALNRGDYFSFNVYSSVATEADTCDDGFKQFSIKEPPQLVAQSNYLQTLGDIMCIISNKLIGS